MDPIRSPKIEAALAQAIAGDVAPFYDQLSRNSGLPGPRPNFDLARALGAAIARAGGKGDALVRALASEEDEYRKIIAAMALEARARAGVDPKGARQDMQTIAEDARHLVRQGIVVALREDLSTRGAEAIADLEAWTDGYLQAHVALEALADRKILDAIPQADLVLARLDEAFQITEHAPRASDRSQGLRILRQEMPRQIAIFAARFSSETIAWLKTKLDYERPESRAIVGEAIAALRKRGLSNADFDRLSESHASTKKPDRNLAKRVEGTRKRSKGRRS